MVMKLSYYFMTV